MTPVESTQPVLYEIRDGAAWVTLALASLTAEVKVCLLDALRLAGDDTSVRAVVLTGVGRNFSLGQDLGEHAEALRSGPDNAFATLREHYEPIVEALTSMPKPVVAAINGTCVGAGLSLALACDIRLARAGAAMATAFTGIGLSFDSGLSATLARAVGTARASELVMLGRRFSAEQAESWGLVGQVVADDDWDEAVRATVNQLAAGPTQAFAAAKRAICDSWSAPLPEVLSAERTAQIALGATSDHRGAVEAFLDKRRPSFDGRR